MKPRQRLLCWCVAAFVLDGLVWAAPAEPPDDAATTPRPYPERLRWWAEARFGMFIHWGPVSLKGTEISWSRANTNPKCPNQGEIPADVYDNLYKDFNPTNFNAGQWAAAARDGGAKYLVLTAKHCDGFLLWHSKTDPYNVAATPFQRDVCAELAAAAHAAGMRLGWYFSPMDWRDPEFRTERNATFLARMKGQLRELLGQYGTIDLLWFDHDGHEAVYDQVATYGLVKALQPRIVINNRLDLSTGQGNRLPRPTRHHRGARTGHGRAAPPGGQCAWPGFTHDESQGHGVECVSEPTHLWSLRNATCLKRPGNGYPCPPTL